MSKKITIALIAILLVSIIVGIVLYFVVFTRKTISAADLKALLEKNDYVVIDMDTSVYGEEKCIYAQTKDYTTMVEFFDFKSEEEAKNTFNEKYIGDIEDTKNVKEKVDRPDYQRIVLETEKDIFNQNYGIAIRVKDTILMIMTTDLDKENDINNLIRSFNYLD